MEIWLPPSVMGRQPLFNCRICGEKFLTGDGQARHVAKCYRRNEPEVRGEALREKAPSLFGDNNVDVEFMDWHKRHNYRKVNQ